MKQIVASLTLALAFFYAAGADQHNQPQVGQRAPNFKLQDQNNRWHSLDSFRGNWVTLYFYPKADTPGCTTESCAFRDDIFKFKDMGIRIVGISLDDVASQKEFAEKYHLPFPLLSDAKQKTAKAYGVLGKYKDLTIAKRETFVIDPEGQIVKHYQKVDPETHAQQVLADISQIIASAPKVEVGDL